MTVLVLIRDGKHLGNGVMMDSIAPTRPNGERWNQAAEPRAPRTRAPDASVRRSPEVSIQPLDLFINDRWTT